jgi:hypothetical protein
MSYSTLLCEESSRWRSWAPAHLIGTERIFNAMIGPRHIGDPGSWVTRVLHFSSTSTLTSDKWRTPLALLAMFILVSPQSHILSVLVRSLGHWLPYTDSWSRPFLGLIASIQLSEFNHWYINLFTVYCNSFNGFWAGLLTWQVAGKHPARHYFPISIWVHRLLNKPGCWERIAANISLAGSPPGDYTKSDSLFSSQAFTQKSRFTLQSPGRIVPDISSDQRTIQDSTITTPTWSKLL